MVGASRPDGPRYASGCLAVRLVQRVFTAREPADSLDLDAGFVLTQSASGGLLRKLFADFVLAELDKDGTLDAALLRPFLTARLLNIAADPPPEPVVDGLAWNYYTTIRAAAIADIDGDEVPDLVQCADGAQRCPGGSPALHDGPCDSIIRSAMNPEAALVNLLLSLFDNDELRRFLAHGDEGEEIMRRLPDSLASPNQMTFVAVDVLKRRNLADDRFFQRLEEAVPRRSVDIQRVKDLWNGAALTRLSGKTSPSPRICTIPPPPGDFIGRKNELSTLGEHIHRHGIIIAGASGSGKTSLAVVLAYAIEAEFPDGLLTVNLQGFDTSPREPSDALKGLLEQLGSNVPHDLDGRINLLRAKMHGKRFLVLLDNAQDAQHVKHLVPPSTCLALVTSRQAFVLPGFHLHRLELLDAAAAVTLVRQIAPRLSHGEGVELARACGNLPLALRISASTLAEEEDLDTAEYLESLKTMQGRLGALEPVMSALESTVMRLDGACRVLLHLVGIFSFPFTVAEAGQAAGMPDEEAAKNLRKLHRYSLIDWNSERGSYSLHDLTRDYARSNLSGTRLIAVLERCITTMRSYGHAAKFQHPVGFMNVLYNLARGFSKIFTWDHILRLAVRDEFYSQTGVSVIGVLYDTDPQYMKSLGISAKFSEREDELLAYYCKLRERYSGRDSMSILGDPKLDFNIDGFTLLRDDEYDSGFYLNKWANRGDIVFAQYAIPVQPVPPPEETV